MGRDLACRRSEEDLAGVRGKWEPSRIWQCVPEKEILEEEGQNLREREFLVPDSLDCQVCLESFSSKSKSKLGLSGYNYLGFLSSPITRG
jgi:hypothetical protein